MPYNSNAVIVDVGSLMEFLLQLGVLLLWPEASGLASDMSIVHMPIESNKETYATPVG